ncbi:MAG: LytR C-terminal domain-containing protein [Ignavibacteria bacterium]|nr:LytR C-terminal domain-containing protein [Ignavibacteria bacterium]
MYTKIKNIFFFATIFFSLFILALFGVSIYVKHFTPSSSEEPNKEDKILFGKTVTILNGTEVFGLAKEMKLFLKTFEINVSNVKNSDSLVSKTHILTKSDGFPLAEYISKLINLGPENIIKQEEISSDVIIIIGKDYKLIKPFKN